MKTNRLLTFVITLAFTFVSMLACFPGVSLAASTITVGNKDYENAYAVLNTICPDFPLVENAASSDAAYTTRAEFVAAVTMALNMPAGTVSDTGFADVPANHKYASNIAYASGLGLISNVDLFYPDSPVTYAQAIKIVMCAIGYGKKAEFTGGFPTGYLKAANETGVGRNVDAGNEDYLSYKAATSIIFDACVTDMLETTSFGSSYEYTVTEGKNILSTYHDIYIATGVVEANENTGILGINDLAGEDTIAVNGKNFANAAGYENFIGKNVRVFYGDDNKNSIVFAYEHENTVYEYTNKDTIAISGHNLTVTPFDGDKDIKYNLEGDYSVIYNGKYYGANDYSSVLNPLSGTVTFIDNDDNRSIDVIIIKDIAFGVVASVNTYEEKIYDKYKKGGLVDLSEMNYFISDQNGTALELFDLVADTAVGYVISKDGKLCEIICYTERVGGVFDGTTSEGKICLGDKEFELSKYYTDNIKGINELKFGTEVILHLSTSGQVIFMQEFATSLKYGVLVKAGSTSGLGAEQLALICTDAGELTEFTLADKVKYNGETKTVSQMKTILETLEAKDVLYRVIKYSVNAEGELNKLYDTVAYTGDPGAVFLKEKVDESQVVLYSDNTQHESSGTVFYKSGVFFPLFHQAPGAPILRVPTSAEFLMDQDYYSAQTSTTLGDYAEDISENVKCFGYDVDKNGANFVLWTLDGGGGNTVSEESGSAIVESITDGANEDGSPVKVIKLYYNKAWKKYYSLPESEYPAGSENTIKAINTMKPGDIVRVSVNSKDEITAAEINFSYSGNSELSIPEKGIVSGHKNQVYGGKVAGYVSGYIYSLANKKAMIVRDKTIDEIAAGSFELKNLHAATLASGTVVFVKMNRDRNTNSILSAEVYTEKDVNVAESFFTAGKDADFVVQRSRYLAVSLTVVYVN